MNARHAVAIAVLLALVSALSSPAFGTGMFRSIALRVCLPWTGAPLLFGAEVTVPLAFGIGAGSFFLAVDGRALILLSADIPVTSAARGGGTFLRATGGLAYFDPGRLYPTPTGGLGLAYRAAVLSSVEVDFAGEFLYPIAVPLPLFSASIGWKL
jgi:hypothetical protein